MLWELWTSKVSCLATAPLPLMPRRCTCTPPPQEPYADINYHALLMQLAANPDLRPPLPTGPDWGPDPGPPEPAPGWADLMTRCWATDPQQRPPFSEVARALKHMASALRRGRQQVAPSEPSLGGDTTLGA